MNIDIDGTIFDHCQSIGFSRDLITQAWIECQGNKEISLDTLLDTLYNLRCQRQMLEIIRRAKYPKIKRIPKSTLLKKLPRAYHLKLKFKGDNALEFLALRKLGLFSKKIFRDIKGLSLEYITSNYYRYFENKHVSILANHMNRGLRKLNNLSIALESRLYGRGAKITPLLRSIKQTFVCLGSLKLSFRGDFRSSGWELLSFERLLARIRSSLKHLALDFTQNYNVNESFSEGLGMIIMNRLHKLETLSLNFNSTKTSTRIVHLLMSGACTHLTNLKKLNVNVKRCNVPLKPLGHPKHNITNSLEELIVNFDYCRDLGYEDLALLKDEIVVFYPKLKELLISVRGCKQGFNDLYSALEREFLDRLSLKRFMFLYSNDLENTWNAYQKAQVLEREQAMKMEEEVEKVKQRAGGEEEIHLYYKMMVEEQQLPGKYQYLFGGNQYLENNLENQFFDQQEIEEEAQDDLLQMAQEYGEAVFGEQFWREKEENERYYDEYDDPIERWSMEEEILREFEKE